MAHTPIGNPLTVHATDDQEQRTDTPKEHRRIDDNGGDDEDIRRLAIIQGRLSFNSAHRTRDRRMNNDGNRDSGNNQHGGNQNSVTATGRVWRGRLNSDHHGNANRPPSMNHHANPNWVNNPRGDHGHRRQARDNNQALETYRISYHLFFRTCVTLFRHRPEFQPSDTIYGHIH